jgi:glycosyltransferase involved in cell wall biosynthesis
VRVSVIVPFRDAEKYLARCLGALVAQEPVDGGYEILAIDDRSSDRSAAIARRFPGVRVLTSSGPGPYAARNTGITAAGGEILALTDGDCETAADWLQQIVQAFTPPGAAVLVGPRLPARDSFALGLLSAYERAKDEYVFGDLRSELYYASANNMAIRRETWDAVGAFEQRRRGADTLYVRRVAATFSPDSVRYAHRLRVRHLEVDGLGAYYRKLLAYGGSARRLEGSSGRVLRRRERLGVWRATVRREQLSYGSSAALLLALGGGDVCWALGGLTALGRLR